MNVTYISLGSNLGNREEYLSKVKQLIEQKTGKILKCSSIYETEPWQFKSSQQSAVSSQFYFLNQVLSIETQLSPIVLLNCLLEIELSLGRKRIYRDEIASSDVIPEYMDSEPACRQARLRTPKSFSPRTIDLDILFYNDLILNEPGLTIPHLLLHERRFVLLPLSEIAPALIHPILKKSVKDLLKDCIDNSEVNIYEYR